MSKEIDLIIPIGTELFYTGDNTDYFTKGKGYKIRKHAIEYVIDDNHEGNHHWNESILDTFSITKEETKPVYTQLMADNCELPSVGMECMVLNKHFDNAEYERCTISYKGSFTFIYDSESCKERVGHIDEVTFKPINQRTNKQKLDDALDQFSYKKETWTHMSFTEAVDLGHIPYLEYTGEK